MNGSIGIREMMLNDHLSHDQQESLLLIHSLACDLVNDILDISEIECGRMTMVAAPYSLRHTIVGVLRTLVVDASQDHLDLPFDVEPGICNPTVFTLRRMKRNGHISPGPQTVSTRRGQSTVVMVRPISQRSSMEATLAKMAPLAERTTPLIDALVDKASVVDRIREFNRHPHVLHPQPLE
ncbi:hypothetical protein NMY22_g14420 [Coprinellus aureogranulatus]|nr:hypothetical protein NMY22_g14420 [Coprinellus aureogranulatus]